MAGVAMQDRADIERFWATVPERVRDQIEDLARDRSVSIDDCVREAIRLGVSSVGGLGPIVVGRWRSMARKQVERLLSVRDPDGHECNDGDVLSLLRELQLGSVLAESMILRLREKPTFQRFRAVLRWLAGARRDFRDVCISIAEPRSPLSFTDFVNLVIDGGW